MLNKIMLIGRLGSDPQLNYTASGKAVAKFSVAVNLNKTDQTTGEKTTETQWFPIVAWENNADMCVKFLHKGSQVYVEGRMTSRKYQNKDGVEVTAWEVILGNMQMLDPKSAGQDAGVGEEEAEGEQVPF